MAAPYNFAGFTTLELTTFHTKVKALMMGVPDGRIIGGSSAGQQFQIEQMSIDQLLELNHALTEALGLSVESGQMSFARPDFSGRPCYY